MANFLDKSTASDFEKAKRFLKSIINIEDFRYFYEDGFPCQDELSHDAMATLEVLESLSK